MTLAETPKNEANVPCSHREGKSSETKSACDRGRETMNVEPVDSAPFALPNTPPGELWFEEPRDIVRAIVEFVGVAPRDVSVSYLQKGWPDIRMEDAEQAHPMHLGWAHQDDLFNTKWHEAAIAVSRETDHRIRIEFQGLKAELPDIKDYDVTFRRTLGLRVHVPDPTAIQKMDVYTVSPVARSILRVELDAGHATSGKTVRISGYNAYIESLEAVEGVRVNGDCLELENAARRQFRMTVRHMIPTYRYSNDSGLVTFALDDDAFTISLRSLEEEGPIWFEDYGFFIAQCSDPTTFAEYKDRLANEKMVSQADYRFRIPGFRTISERVREHPEQNLAGALHGQPRPHPVSYNLGCSHARQRFRLEANGDIVLTKTNATWIRGKDTDRFKNRGSSIFFFGLENWFIFARFPDPEPALVYNIHARREGLVVEQKSFAVPLLTPIATESWAGDDPVVALVRFRFRNAGGEPVVAELPISYSQGFVGPALRLTKDKLTVSGTRIESDWQGHPVLRCTVQTTMSISEHGDRVTLAQRLEPGETCEATLKIPFIALETPDELKAFDTLQFDPSYQQVVQYWQEVGRRGASVHTPEPQLAALHTSHLAHVLVTDMLMPDGSGLVNTSVGTSTYGNFSNEACMIVNDLDQRGLHDEARKRLGIWLKYQGTVPQPGNFTDYDGMFYGAGGYECGAYNQHHGWVLWCLCEHFFLTRDEEWLRSVADKVIAGAEWVFRQRRNTMTTLPHSRGWEHGFLPAGSLEDVTDFYYWLSTNALTWRGVEWAARALEAIKHPEAARVRKEADAYRTDLVRGFEIARQHAPLVRLRDGRWVPHYPSRLYRRGREIGWIRETLEGSVYLLISGLYDVHGREAKWILDDYQDNRYVKPPYGYLIPDFEMRWFDRGGFSMQPNLLAGLLPHLDRDEPEIYIWMFYNAWAACYREEINAMVEHPAPVLGYSNAAHFKTSDESNAMTWLRYMFVYAKNDLLHFGRAIPRAWFGQTIPFEARDVATKFGKVSVRYEPLSGKNAVKATAFLNLEKQPGKVLVRFRLPEKCEIRSVRVNGAPHSLFDPQRGDVDITGHKGKAAIEVDYGNGKGSG